MDAAAPGWSRSSEPANRFSTRAARSADSRSQASRNALPTEACSRSGRWPSTLRSLCTWHRCTTPREPNTSVMARRSPRRAVDDEQQRPVRRQAARDQIAEQAAGDDRRLGGPFAQSQHVLAALRVDPQRDHHAMVPEDLAVDADHPQVQLAQRPAEKRPQALGRQRHEPPRHRAARRPPLRHLGRRRVQGARIPPRRDPGGDRGQRVLVQRVGGRRPSKARQRLLAVGAPHAQPRHGNLAPAKRHLTGHAPAAPRGPST